MQGAHGFDLTVDDRNPARLYIDLINKYRNSDSIAPNLHIRSCRISISSRNLASQNFAAEVRASVPQVALTRSYLIQRQATCLD